MWYSKSVWHSSAYWHTFQNARNRHALTESDAFDASAKIVQNAAYQRQFNKNAKQPKYSLLCKGWGVQTPPQLPHAFRTFTTEPSNMPSICGALAIFTTLRMCVVSTAQVTHTHKSVKCCQRGELCLSLALPLIRWVLQAGFAGGMFVYTRECCVFARVGRLPASESRRNRLIYLAGMRKSKYTMKL